VKILVYPFVKTVNSKEATKLLKEANQIIVAVEKHGFSRAYQSKFPYFALYIENIKNGESALTKLLVEDCPYYSKRMKAYEMSVWGADRIFALFESIVGDYKLANELMQKTYFLAPEV